MAKLCLVVLTASLLGGASRAEDVPMQAVYEPGTITLAVEPLAIA